jgi:hypothetical protein
LWCSTYFEGEPGRRAAAKLLTRTAGAAEEGRGKAYYRKAVKIFMPAGSKQPVVVHYTEHMPPDVTAAFIWLKNRNPERWRDVQNVEHAIGKYIISDHPPDGRRVGTRTSDHHRRDGRRASCFPLASPGTGDH